MRKTLVLLLTVICANIAFAQQNPYLDHPNGTMLSSAEKHSIETLLMELLANPSNHSRAELERYGKDIQHHIDHTTSVGDMIKMQNQMETLSHISAVLSSVISTHANRIGESTKKFDDKVTLQFQGKNKEAISLVLGMDSRSGDYVISSVHRDH